MSPEEENKEKEKKNESKHARLPTRKSGWRQQRKKLTPEEGERILRRVFLGEED